MQQTFETFPFRLSTGQMRPLDGPVIGKAFAPTKRREVIIEMPPETPPPPPTFSEAELAAAKEAAYQRGFEEGEMKGKAIANSELAKLDQSILALIPGITQKVHTSLQHYRAFIDEQKQAMPKLAEACAKKLCGDLPPEFLLEQLTKRTIDCVERILGEPEIFVFVHPDLSDNLETKLAAHFAKSHEPGDIFIHKDPELPLSDCRVEWQFGGMAYQQGVVEQALQRMIEGLSQQPAAAETDEALEALLSDAHIESAVSEAIAHQLTNHEIPPIPDDPLNTQAADHHQPHTTPPQGDAS